MFATRRLESTEIGLKTIGILVFFVSFFLGQVSSLSRSSLSNYIALRMRRYNVKVNFGRFFLLLRFVCFFLHRKNKKCSEEKVFRFLFSCAFLFKKKLIIRIEICTIAKKKLGSQSTVMSEGEEN